jgi:hypothetical protein
MLSDKAIQVAKNKFSYGDSDPLHEHNDCIRIAYQWLDAQVKIKEPYHATRPIKHLIEKWAGRYVSVSDVEVAASLHPEIAGRCPYFNISVNLTEPSISRLDGVGQAFTQDYRSRHDATVYVFHEH